MSRKSASELVSELSPTEQQEIYTALNAERRKATARRKDALANFQVDLDNQPELFYVSYDALRTTGLQFDGSDSTELVWFINKIKYDVGGNVKKITQAGLDALNATRDYASIIVSDVQFRSTSGKPAAALVFPHRATGTAEVFVKELITLLDAPWEAGVRAHLETSTDAAASINRIFTTPELKAKVRAALSE